MRTPAPLAFAASERLRAVALRAPLAATLLAGASLGQIASPSPCPTRAVDPPTPAPSDMFGFAVAGLADLNGDGFPEFAVGAPYADGTLGAIDAGRVTVHDGRDGDVIPPLSFPLIGPAALDAHFGHSVARFGNDLLVGAPDYFPNGRAYLLSGTTGVALKVMSGTQAGGLFGYSVAAIGDLNANGTMDIAVGAPGADSVFAFDGQPGPTPPLSTIQGSPCTYFGRVVAALGDADSDGVPDFLVGAANCTACACPNGGVSILSGMSVATGTPTGILTVYGASAWTFGSAVVGLEDVTGDAIPDFAVGVPEYDQAIIYSGANGTLWQTLTGAPNSYFGGGLANVGDVNGDQLDDLLVGSPATGEARIFSLSNNPANPAGTIYTFNGAIGASPLADPVAVSGTTHASGVGVIVMGDPFATVGGAADAGRANVLFVGLPPGSTPVPGSAGCDASPPTAGPIPEISILGGSPPGGLSLAQAGNPATGFVARRVAGGTVAVLVLGLSSLVPPAPLGGLGLPGCGLSVSLDFLFAAGTTGYPGATGDGVAYIGIGVPPNPALVGASIYGQWYVLDLAPALLPGSMTAAVDLVL